MPEPQRDTPLKAPWNSVFKLSMADKATAWQLITRNAPPALLALCNTGSLTMQPSEFIDDVSGSEYRADVVYSLQTLDGDGQVFFLLEHQATIDAGLAWRIVHYRTCLMNRCRKQYGTLPLVIPIVIYNGTRRLTTGQSELDWTELVPAKLRGFFREQLLKSVIQEDIGAYSDSEIIAHGRCAVMEMVLKHGRKPVGELLTALHPVLFNKENCSQDVLRETLRMICNINGLTVAELADCARQVNHKFEVTMIDAITQLEMEGEARGEIRGEARGIAMGEARGEARGIARGRNEALRATALNLFSKGIDTQIIAESTGLTLEQLHQLGMHR